MISTHEPEISTGAIQPSDQVRDMFDSIAGRYDLMNHLLSAGIDRLWWRRAARAVRPILIRPEARILDLCCGTGDMTLALLKHRPSTPSTAPILAVDFSHRMLSIGKTKLAQSDVLPIEADALHLPLASDSLDLVSSAFGFRNLADYEAGLAELFRVLRPGGEIAILDCNQPDGLLGAFYNLHLHRILPLVGAILSNPAAYSYLPASIARFPRPPRMLEMIQAAGFRSATWTSYTFGIAGLYRATKPGLRAQDPGISRSLSPEP
jgi:demethylmenaquinone methyltransferase / 2-methoxy-6-polyprenyl-1,4-benzoquinol methylase